MDKVFGQHGDVGLHQVKSIPIWAKKLKTINGFVVERGEGIHTHTLVCDDVSKVDLYDLEGTLYLHVKKDVQIYHEEHKLKTLTPGIYKKVLEREWDYESEESRKTQD